MEWNEQEELKGLLAANKRKPVICEKKKKKNMMIIRIETDAVKY